MADNKIRIVKLNTNEIKDKIYACWIGKNIGGTMGAPYEGTKEILNVSGFKTPAGKIIPNDDLDLQLVFLLALEQVGPWSLTANSLAEYWISYITMNCAEYNIAKSNLRMGIMPGASGELNNEKFKHSNGGWIRSEIWACTAPGFPKIAVRYAFMDSSIDHGMGEGTYAEMFTAALQSIAFYEKDHKKLISKALEYIPHDCRVTEAVEYVVNEYDKGIDWVIVRNGLVNICKDLGWFMAPANVGFVILGLLYGEGDFKKSMLRALNCGDDTDCTAATLGALMGIMYGTKCLPADWVEHIGDEIWCDSIDTRCTVGDIPKSCTELTERVMQIMPSVFKANRICVKLTDGESDFSEHETYDKWYDIKTLTERKRYSTEAYDFTIGMGHIQFDSEPCIAPLETISFVLKLINKMHDCRYYNLQLIMPDGWTAEYPKSFFVPNGYMGHIMEPGGYHGISIKITAGENVFAQNRIFAVLTSNGRPTVGVIPIMLLGD